jgi:hypothetical protein
MEQKGLALGGKKNKDGHTTKIREKEAGGFPDSTGERLVPDRLIHDCFLNLMFSWKEGYYHNPFCVSIGKYRSLSNLC